MKTLFLFVCLWGMAISFGEGEENKELVSCSGGLEVLSNDELFYLSKPFAELRQFPVSHDEALRKWEVINRYLPVIFSPKFISHHKSTTDHYLGEKFSKECAKSVFMKSAEFDKYVELIVGTFHDGSSQTDKKRLCFTLKSLGMGFAKDLFYFKQEKEINWLKEEILWLERLEKKITQLRFFSVQKLQTIARLKKYHIEVFIKRWERERSILNIINDNIDYVDGYSKKISFDHNGYLFAFYLAGVLTNINELEDLKNVSSIASNKYACALLVYILISFSAEEDWFKHWDAKEKEKLFTLSKWVSDLSEQDLWDLSFIIHSATDHFSFNHNHNIHPVSGRLVKKPKTKPFYKLGKKEEEIKYNEDRNKYFPDTNKQYNVPYLESETPSVDSKIKSPLSSEPIFTLQQKTEKQNMFSRLAWAHEASKKIIESLTVLYQSAEMKVLSGIDTKSRSKAQILHFLQNHIFTLMQRSDRVQSAIYSFETELENLISDFKADLANQEKKYQASLDGSDVQALKYEEMKRRLYDIINSTQAFYLNFIQIKEAHQEVDQTLLNLFNAYQAEKPVFIEEKISERLALALDHMRALSLLPL